MFDLYEKAMYAGKPFSERTIDNWIRMLMGNEPESCAMCGHCNLNYLI